MRYSKGLVLYQDDPGWGLFLKLITVIGPAALLASSYYLFSRGETEGGRVLLLEAFIFSAIFLAIFPRSYRIYEDHLRIVLGGPFSIKIGLDKIKSVEVTGKLNFSINFATRMTGIYVAIIMKKGMTIAITPKDNNQFVENANRALSEWAKTNAQLRVV